MELIRKRQQNSQSGQIALIVILLMVVLLITGLSIASQTVKDLALSTSEIESTRVFSAAEAGIEEALSQDFSSLTAGTLEFDNAQVNYQIESGAGFNAQVFEGQAVKVDLAGAPNGSGLTIDWSEETDCALSAAILASVYYDDGGSVAVDQYALKGPGCSGEGFQEASLGGAYNFTYTISLPDSPIEMRLRPLFADTMVTVTGDGFVLPPQYFSIRSEARSTLGDEMRVVVVNRSTPSQPSVLDFALFSGGNIVK